MGLNDAYASGPQQQGQQYMNQQPGVACGQQQLQGAQWQAALQMQAGGQQMVLDLDEYVAGMDKSICGLATADSRMIAAV